MSGFETVTERLRLRSWCDDDVVPFQAICSDPDVMATLGPPLRPHVTYSLSRMTWKTL